MLPAAASTVKVGSWKPAFIGIDQPTATMDGEDASVAYVLRVDLQAQGIRFYSRHTGKPTDDRFGGQSVSGEVWIAGGDQWKLLFSLLQRSG